MKRLLFSLIICVSLTGCIGLGKLNPFNWGLASTKTARATNKIEEVQKNIAKTEDAEIEKARGYQWGTKLSLDTNKTPSKETELAESFNNKAILSLGPPSMQSARDFEKIVDGLLSTNKQLVASAQKLLDSKDNELIKLQKIKNELEIKLDKKEEAFKELSEKQSLLANKWQKLTRIFTWGFYAIIIGFIVSVILNNLPPPYNLLSTPINIIFGAAGKMIYGLFPKVREFSGSVAHTAFATSENTLSQLVSCVESFKVQNPALYKEKFEGILRSGLDKEHKQKIDSARNNLGFKGL